MSTESASSRIAQLAALIANNVATVDNHVHAQSLDSPSFDVDCTTDIGAFIRYPDVENARVATIEAAMELQDLLQGSVALLAPPVEQDHRQKKIYADGCFR